MNQMVGLSHILSCDGYGLEGAFWIGSFKLILHFKLWGPFFHAIQIATLDLKGWHSSA